jgi:hypothetical protein
VPQSSANPPTRAGVSLLAGILTNAPCAPCVLRGDQTHDYPLVLTSGRVAHPYRRSIVPEGHELTPGCWCFPTIVSNCEQARPESVFILWLGIETAITERPRFLSFPWLGPVRSGTTVRRITLSIPVTRFLTKLWPGSALTSKL